MFIIMNFTFYYLNYFTFYYLYCFLPFYKKNYFNNYRILKMIIKFK